MTPAIPVKSSIVTEKVARYVIEKVVLDSELESDLRRETLTRPHSGMISSSDVGRLLNFLVQSVQAKNALEIGTFTGYTALKIASGLTAGGKLICCDIDAENGSIAERYWRKAHLDSRIDLRLAPAEQTLQALVDAGQSSNFDFAFIDADKGGYEIYYELCLKLVRPRGLIVLDNMLWDGAVADEVAADKTTALLRELNHKISRDARVNSVLLTVGDGLMLARRNS